MKIKGLKEIKKGAKLHKKKLKIENSIEKLSKEYYAAVNFNLTDSDYFINGVKSYIKQQNNKK